MTETPLRLFNSLTRKLEDFAPLTGNEARVYTCGPTVYNYQHIGNMRAYIFADTLGRALSFKGYDLKHVINITDVGHLTSDADAGDDKMEKAAAAQGKTAWDIAKFYQADFENDLARLNIRPTEHPRATDYVEAMIAWAKSIADTHCYVLDGGLYFDTSTVPSYGALARANTDDGQSRIDPVPGKRHPQDFAIWRTTPPGETRQMEWGSPWGRGAPGWHLECSVMSGAILGFPFDIHTGGIDHREIHHPCEIAQNQAHQGGADSGARIWMHNNFLIDRRGKMSKSSGEFLRLQTLVDRGFHPLAYRMMCLQAHYRSEMEFTWEGLAAAFTRLKRIVGSIEGTIFGAGLKRNTIIADINEFRKSREFTNPDELLPEKRFEWDFYHRVDKEADFYQYSVRTIMRKSLFDDISTPNLLSYLENLLKEFARSWDLLKAMFVMEYDSVLGLNLLNLTREDLRIRPATATLTEADIEARLDERKAARAAKDFATSDRIRDDLIAQGVEIMDGDPLGWDWKLDI
jgi:cysteinyl-tRNA synthetase